MMHSGITFLFQIFLCMIIFIQMWTSQQYYQVLAYRAPTKIIMCRYICAIILHLTLVDELAQKMDMMKFVCNHPYKFKASFWAFLAPF